MDHLVVLVFATVAALRLTTEWGLRYGALVPYATPSFIAFGLCATSAGWLADRWSRERIMVILFIGIGASALLANLANYPVQLSLRLTLVGVFGNMGVASVGLLSDFLIDTSGWCSAFFIPGVVSMVIGELYLRFVRMDRGAAAADLAAATTSQQKAAPPGRETGGCGFSGLSI